MRANRLQLLSAWCISGLPSPLLAKQNTMLGLKAMIMQPLVQYLRYIKVTPCLARGGYGLSTFGQDFPGGAGDLKILVPRFWYQDVGTKILVPKS